jgi:hypothetical protein
LDVIHGLRISRQVIMSNMLTLASAETVGPCANAVHSFVQQLFNINKTLHTNRLEVVPDVISAKLGSLDTRAKGLLTYTSCCVAAMFVLRKWPSQGKSVKEAGLGQYPCPFT